MTAPMLPDKELAQVLSDRTTRVNLTRSSHFWFFNTYLARYVKHPTAPFQRELFGLTENVDIKYAIIVAFRGSAKSTIIALSYVLWAILGTQQKKFILILSQTQSQARSILGNIKRELETNDLLRNDYGALEHQTDEWARDSLVIKGSYNARIMAASTETSIRGIRHGEHRPDLIICDDVEDLNSVKTREGRNKTYNWLMGDVIPAGDSHSKFLVIGNLLHEDSLLMRLKQDLDQDRLKGVFRWYPLLDSNNAPLWSGKFPTTQSIEDLKKTVPSEVAWQREYLLRIIADQEQVVHPSWIHRYEELPKYRGNYLYTAVGIDLAISKKDTADCTAMVIAEVHARGNNMRVYIYPHPINQKLDFPEQIALIKDISRTHKRPDLFIEDVAYQAAIIQELQHRGYDAQGIKVHGQDKRARLTTITHLIKNGQVLFPKEGCEELITQLTGFGVENHDDLADAFAILMHAVMENNSPGPSISWLSYGPPDRGLWQPFPFSRFG